ncbi:unnamed protein product [Arabidopsis halleri]
MNGQVQPSLRMVHLVDGLTVNLISISQLCDDGLDVTFTKNICTAIDKQGAVRLEGQKSGNNCYTWKSDGVAKKEASLKNLHKYISDRELVAGCESITLDSMGAVHVELWSQQQSMSLIIDGFSLWTLVRHPCEVSDVLLMTSYAMQKMVTERNHSFHHNRGEIQGDRVTRGLQRGLMITDDTRGWRVAMQQEFHQHKRWVHKSKIDDLLLVAQGYDLVKCAGRDELFPPLDRLESLRFLIGIACLLKIKLHLLDVRRSTLLRKTYVESTSRSWYDHLAMYHTNQGYEQGSSDKSVFNLRINNEVMVVQIYFEGIVKQSDNGIFVTQSAYANSLIVRFGMEASPVAETPMGVSANISKDEDGEIVDEDTPKRSHLMAMQRILKYVKGTANLGIYYSKDTDKFLMGYSIADGDSSLSNQRSTSGGYLFMGNNLVLWSSKQKTQGHAQVSKTEKSSDVSDANEKIQQKPEQEFTSKCALIVLLSVSGFADLDSASESSQQPKSSSPVMNKSESGLNDKLQSPQQTQFGDSKMVRNESVMTSDVQSRSPQRTEIRDPEKAIMVIREHQTEGKASVEQVASPIPSVIVELTDDGDSSVAPQSPSVSSRLRKRKGVLEQCSERKTKQKTAKGNEPADSGQDFDHVRFNSADAQKSIDLIVNAGLLRTVTEIQDAPSEVLWEFWSNLPSVKVESATVDVLVRDWVYEFSPARINALFGLPAVDEREQHKQMVGVIDEDLAMFMSGGKIKLCQNVHLGDVESSINKDLLKICCTNWAPTTNESYLAASRSRVVYMIAKKVPFNFGRLVFEHVLQLARTPAAKFHLPFPSLIYKLLQAQHPVKADCELKNIKKGKSVKKNSGSATPFSIPPEALGNRKAMKLAILILQAALDAEPCFMPVGAFWVMCKRLLEYQTKLKRGRLKMQILDQHVVQRTARCLDQEAASDHISLRFGIDLIRPFLGEWANPGLTSFSAWRGRHVHVLPDDETHNIQNISNHPALPTPLEPRNDFWVHDHASEARLDPEFVEEFSRCRLNDLVNGNGGRSVGTSNGRGTSNDGGASNDAAASNGRESHDRVTSWDW